MLEQILSLLPLVALAVMAGCEQATAPAASRDGRVPALDAADAPDGPFVTEHIHSTDPLAFEFEDPCTGEVVALSGTLTADITLVGLPADIAAGLGYQHITGTLIARLTGTGTTSGTVYSFQDIQHQIFESPSGPAPHGVVSMSEIGQAISRGPGGNFILTVDLHLVLLPPDARMVVTVDNFRAECRG
jgi:hypothetical protein